jgi:hypothetical protein
VTNNINFLWTVCVNGQPWAYSGYTGSNAAYVHPAGIINMRATYSGAQTNGDTVSAWAAAWMHNYICVVLGAAVQAGLAISATTQTRLEEVFDYTIKTVIERAGTAVGGNWRRFRMYAWPVGEPATDLPTTKYTTAQSYAKYLQTWGLNASLPATPNSTLLSHGSDTNNGDADIVSDSGNSYIASGLAALALAVDRGTPGAQAAWGSITTASNFNYVVAYYAAGSNTTNGNQMGVVPR